LVFSIIYFSNKSASDLEDSLLVIFCVALPIELDDPCYLIMSFFLLLSSFCPGLCDLVSTELLGRSILMFEVFDVSMTLVVNSFIFLAF